MHQTSPQGSAGRRCPGRHGAPAWFGRAGWRVRMQCSVSVEDYELLLCTDHAPLHLGCDCCLCCAAQGLQVHDENNHGDISLGRSALPSRSLQSAPLQLTGGREQLPGGTVDHQPPSLKPRELHLHFRARLDAVHAVPEMGRSVQEPMPAVWGPQVAPVMLSAIQGLPRQRVQRACEYGTKWGAGSCWFWGAREAWRGGSGGLPGGRQVELNMSPCGHLPCITEGLTTPAWAGAIAMRRRRRRIGGGCMAAGPH